jgi:hypothetical protein
MNPNLDDLLQKRATLLQQMQTIDRLRRGTLSQQFFKAKAPEGGLPRGPYYVLQGFFRGKKFSRRIPQDQAAQVQQEVDNYRRFQTLAEEFVTVNEQITDLQDQPQHLKKNSSRKRSPTNSSKKPTPS